MQINLLKQIVEHVAGGPATKIVDLLFNKKGINEFVIAKKLGMTINQTRNLLYKMSHFGILSSTRKKDERKGWYIYFWTLNTLKSLEILEENLVKEITQLHKALLDKQSKRFYRCKICSIESTEEDALLNDFVCAECGEVYELSDNAEHLKSITKNLSKFQKELEIIRQEIQKEKSIQDKKLKQKIKKAEKVKKEARKTKAKLRKKLKKKLLKKIKKGKKAKGRKFKKKPKKKRR